MGQAVSLTKDQILTHIPHRPPFLFIDEVVSVVKGDSIKAVLYLDPAAEYFKGHFPANPIMPGALMLEALAQTTCVLFDISQPSKEKRTFYVGSVKMRFLKPVKPENTLGLFSKAITLVSKGGIFEVNAQVSGEVVLRGEMGCMCVS